jgi:hypothetical protein
LFLLLVASSLILSFRYSRLLFLKYLLVSRFIYFRLSAFISLGYCNHCNLGSFDQIILSIPRRTMAYASSIHNNLETFGRNLIFSLVVSQALLISPHRLHQPKLQTYFKFQHDTSLYPLPRLISWQWAAPYEICALLFTHCQTLLNMPQTISNGYHNLLPWTIGHQVHMNAVSYISKYCQIDCEYYHQGMSK